MKKNKDTVTILESMKPHLISHFPNTQFSLEICDNLGWTCLKTHENPNISDIVYELQLKLFDVDDILDELEEKGFEFKVEY